jgi:hypothetical protein
MTGGKPFRPLQPLRVPALCVRPTPPPVVASAFQQMAQGLDPDAAPPGEAVVLQIEYDAYGAEPPVLGEQYVIYLPNKAPSIEAWYKATAHFRARLSPGEDPSETSS